MTAPWYADGLLTPDEVRRIFHVDRATVYRWGRAGKLDSIRLGESGPCPDCGKPAHYVSHDAHRGWYHDVVARLEDP